MSNALSKKDAIKIGKKCRAAKEGNLVVGSFAAELLDESYPFSMSMAEIVFQQYSDEELGRKFAAWCDAKSA